MLKSSLEFLFLELFILKFNEPLQRNLLTTVRPRFFDQVGHETMYASSGNKHFFHIVRLTKIMNRQKLGTILVNKVSWKSKFPKTFFNKSWSPSQIFLIHFFFGKIRPIFNTENDFDSTHFEMFEEVFHNFGKSDNDMKNAYFP